MSDSKAQDLTTNSETESDLGQPKTATGHGTYRGEEVVTSCAFCCFAEYEDKTQVSCELGRIEKFRERGAEIVEAEDGEREFYLIHRMCNCYREKDWAEYWKDKKKRVLKENSVRVNFIVPINEGDTIEDLQKTLVSIATQDDFEATKVVTMNNSSRDNFEIIHKLHEVFGSYAEQTSYLNKSEEGTTFVGGIMVDKDQDFWTVLEASIDYATNGFYMIAKAGSVVPSDTLSKLNKAVNVELRQLVMVEPKEKESYDGMVVLCALHKYLNGSKNVNDFSITQPVYDKIKHVAKQQEFDSLILNWEDLD
tara:strand:- start:53555 stop:54478 length:924 start_codon:yes stop_codon:yes gene_type:complete